MIFGKIYQIWHHLGQPCPTKWLTGQKLCHCLNQGSTLKDILMKSAHWMAYFDLSKLNLTYTNVMKALKSKMRWCRCDTVALRTTCVKNVKFKIIKKDRLSVFWILSLERKSQLGRTKPLTGPHAARGPRIGHSWSTNSTCTSHMRQQEKTGDYPRQLIESARSTSLSVVEWTNFVRHLFTVRQRFRLAPFTVGSNTRDKSVTF